MTVDNNGNLEVYASSTTNPQSFILPQTEEELDGMASQLGVQLFHNGTFTAFIDEDTREILYYELDVNDDIQIQILTNFDLPLNANCSESQTAIANRGYLWNPHDWKNFEATIWVEVIDVENSNGFVEISGREGYKETTSSRCCVGTSYSVRAYWATSGANKAKTETVKTEWYKSEIPKNTQNINVVPDFRQQLIGLKMAVYNTVESNRNTVVIEHYICPDYDTRDINWTRVSQVRDFVGANWNANGLQCNAPTKDYPIFWGGYFVSFRWAGARTIHFKDLSVREIELDDPDQGGGGDPDPEPNPPAPINNILWTSIGSWDNGHDRTFSAFDPDDNRLEMRAGDNREMHIDGEGNGFQTGARGRQYIYVNNYNASMELWYTPNSSIDNLSLRIRSRHNEGGSCGNAFGGYGLVIEKNLLEFGDETCHDGGTHRGFGDTPINPRLVDGQEYIIKFSVFDVTNGVQLQCHFWENNAWVLKGQATDTNPSSAMKDKELYMEKSYFWVRTNNENGQPEDVKLRNEIMRNLDVQGTPPPPQDPDCPAGQAKNANGDCVPVLLPCPTGQHRDAAGNCVDDPPNQTPCPSGQFRDVFGNCVPQPTTCPAGYQKNAQGVCVPIVVPPQNPPPNQPPATPTSFKRSVTFKRNIINNSLCRCIGVDPGTGTGGGTDPNEPGLRKIYDVSPNKGTKVRLASVESNEDDYYLQYGQVIEKSSSVFNNVTVKRIKIWLAEYMNPEGATGDGVHVVIRDSNDVIKVDFGYINEEAIHDAGSWHTVEKLDNAYRCKVEDRIFFEFDGGDPTDYVILFRKSNQPKTGSKVIYRHNDMDVGDYNRRDYDICMIVEGE